MHPIISIFAHPIYETVPFNISLTPPVSPTPYKKYRTWYNYYFSKCMEICEAKTINNEIIYSLNLY